MGRGGKRLFHAVKGEGKFNKIQNIYCEVAELLKKTREFWNTFGTWMTKIGLDFLFSKVMQDIIIDFW